MEESLEDNTNGLNELKEWLLKIAIPWLWEHSIALLAITIIIFFFLLIITMT